MLRTEQLTCLVARVVHEDLGLVIALAVTVSIFYDTRNYTWIQVCQHTHTKRFIKSAVKKKKVLQPAPEVSAKSKT